MSQSNSSGFIVANYVSKTRPRLALFMSFKGSLAKWQNEGIMSRELALYTEYIYRDIFERIYIFSYSRQDHDILANLRAQNPVFERIEVLTPGVSFRRLHLMQCLVYSTFGILVHHRALRSVDWIKTNQINGCWAAIFAKLVCGRPLLLRFGYILSRRLLYNQKPIRGRIALLLERFAYLIADKIVVTSQDAAVQVRKSVGCSDKVTLIPTFVDTNRFTQIASYNWSAPVVYVGRLEPQKNVMALVDACISMNLPLHLIGRGSLEHALAEIAQSNDVEVRLLGQIANEDLAQTLSQYAVYVLPSFQEGLPKTLIEAMAQGLICLGSNIPGIEDLIDDGTTGYLISDFSSASIADTLSQALQERRKDIGAAARKKILTDFSLDAYVRRESRMLLHSASPVFATEPART